MLEYDLGQAVRLTAAFLNSSGDAADPTTVTFKFGVIAAQPPPDPSATSLVHGSDVSVVKDSVGNYHVDVTPLIPGIYIFQAIGTGNVAAVSTGRFRVLKSPFA